MIGDFMVAALPKSGTSIISTALNQQTDFFCFHDAAELADDPHSLLEHASNLFHYVGDCSTVGFQHRFWDIGERKITVDINPEESWERSEEFLGRPIPSKNWKSIVDSYNRWCDKFQPVTFKREDIFSVPGLLAITKACTDGYGVHEERISMKFEELLRNRIEPLDNTYANCPKSRLETLARGFMAGAA